MAVISGEFCLRIGAAIHKPEPRVNEVTLWAYTAMRDRRQE